ncbi:hypothetical protein KR009_002907 [Drosophila setifemur]|nr:hypothetical protein KR009_002907 [Drosophila setifemur]
MASLTMEGHTEVMHTYQVLRIGSDVNDKTLHYCLPDKNIDKLHATLTKYEKGLYLVNESRHGSVSVNGMRVGGPVHITYRHTRKGIVYLRFGRHDAYLRVSRTLTG